MRKDMKNEDHGGGAAWRAPVRGDHGDDAVLWEMLGDHGDMRTRVDFAARTVAFVEERERRERADAARMRWGWGALVVTAAAASLLVVLNLRPHDDPPKHVEPGVSPIAQHTVSEAALTAYEIDDIEEINQDWFGG